METNEDRLRVALATVLAEDAITLQEALDRASQMMVLHDDRLYLSVDVVGKAFGAEVLAVGRHFTQYGQNRAELVYVDRTLAKLALDRAIDHLEEAPADKAPSARAAVRLGRALSQVVG